MTPQSLSRRTFVASATAALVAFPRAGLLAFPTPLGIRLASRPGKPKLTIAPGLRPLGVATGDRDGRVYIPKSLDPKKTRTDPPRAARCHPELRSDDQPARDLRRHDGLRAPRP